MQRREFRNQTFKSVDEVQTAVATGPAHFFACQFDGLDLRAVCLDDCVFDCGSSLREARLGSCVRAEFYTTDLTRADFTRGDISWAYAKNCQAVGLRFMGVRRTEDCFFLDGLIASEADGWRLAWAATLPDTPARQVIRAQMPKRYQLLIRSQFNLGSRTRK